MFRYRYLLNISIVGFLLLFLAGCQEVIEIDLNSSNPQLVVEGAISSVDSVTWVRLSKTVNFDENNTFPDVKGAYVAITDSKGFTTQLYEEFSFVNEDGATILETSPGYYRAKLIGLVGESYRLDIIENGKSFSTTTFLNPPVLIDTIKVEDTNGFNPPELPSQYIGCSFYDTPNVANQYRFIQSINGINDPYIYVGNDQFTDGKYVKAALFGSELGFVKGDTVTIKLQSIDLDNYNYLMALSRLIGGGDGSVSPTNPRSNFTGGAMGYFYAFSEDKMTIIIQ